LESIGLVIALGFKGSSDFRADRRRVFGKG
jgi:hypothetical protein